MDWDKLRIFHAVSEAGSFTHAGETLNLSQSAVSRQISTLEDSLGTALFHRHARGLILTEQGEHLFKTAQEVFSKLAMAEARLTEGADRPSGPFKITTTVAFGSIWLTPRMKEFTELYPDIEISLVLTEGELDLAMREADVAIRMVPPHQPDLIQRQLMTMHFHIYASPDYIKVHGMPTTQEDLADHMVIVYGEDATPPVAEVNWLYDLAREDHNRTHAVLKVNNIYGIYRAVQMGIGIAALPDYSIRETSNLVRILPKLEGPSFNCYLAYPEELRNSQRIGVFRDYLLRKISESRF
ncbi:MAG: LysR family transcriptional regulator [Alphaproteobacteria bacterium]